jgi:transcriptional regulator with XRE-family HTH domain
MLTFINEKLNRVYSDFGTMLKEAREDANMTIEDLSRESSLPERLIWKYENNLKSVNINDFSKLATALNVLGDMGFRF